jgi:hypothetical protein
MVHSVAAVDSRPRPWWRPKGEHVAGVLFYGVLIAMMASCTAAMNADLVPVEASSRSIARFEMSHSWATLGSSLFILTFFIPIAAAVFGLMAGGLSWLLRRVTPSQVANVISTAIAVGLTVIAVALFALTPGFEEGPSRVDITTTNVEVTTERLASRLGIVDPVVRLVPLADIAMVDLRLDYGDDAHDEATIALRNGKRITLEGGDESRMAGTWELAHTIAAASSVDLRCFEDSERQRCDLLEVAYVGSAG